MSKVMVVHNQLRNKQLTCQWKISVESRKNDSCLPEKIKTGTSFPKGYCTCSTFSQNDVIGWNYQRKNTEIHVWISACHLMTSNGLKILLFKLAK